MVGNDNQITLKINGLSPKQYPLGITLSEVADDNKNVCDYDILSAKINNELYELHINLYNDCSIEFLDIKNPIAFRVYQRSVTFLMIYAVKSVIGEKTRVVVEHSIKKNYYCVIFEPDLVITDEIIQKIEDKMRETVAANLPITRCSLTLEDSFKLAEQFGLYDKIKFMEYRRTAYINFYKLDWFYDYFYGQMVPNTARLPFFKLKREGDGFMLCFPEVRNGEIITEHNSENFTNIQNVFNESSKWAKILKAETVGSLNDIISDGQTGRFIMTNEALHEKRIGQIADQICQKSKKIVLIAGPSSSGKTTFAERLCIQLRVNGLRPHVVSLDNYYKDFRDLPLEKDGTPNRESLLALDVDCFNENLRDLLCGKSAEIPFYNFALSKREYKKGRELRLSKSDVLVVEGIHGLNDDLSKSVPDSDKFKIFISALTQLNIDDHNRIPTTDTRLLRRIVRDNQFRGTDAKSTISMWRSVTRGEEEFIFPFQENADAFFNSALVYEMCVLKQYAEPLLFRIKKNESQYIEARRLIKFLDCFLGLSSEEVPKNSILREFIGGSCFKT